jgi:hypothetical protein
MIASLMHTNIYSIISTHETDDDGNPLWWSNTDGWVDVHNADRFTSIYTLNLPDTGSWVKVAQE